MYSVKVVKCKELRPDISLLIIDGCSFITMKTSIDMIIFILFVHNKHLFVL